LEYSGCCESDVVVGWDPMGYIPFANWLTSPRTLAPFSMILIGPGSSSPKDHPASHQDFDTYSSTYMTSLLHPHPF